MLKKDATKTISAVREACEMATHHLRSTGTRVRVHGEPDGPYPDRPHLIPLTHDERKEKICRAWQWTLVADRRAEDAVRTIHKYAQQNGITEEDFEEFLRRENS